MTGRKRLIRWSNRNREDERGVVAVEAALLITLLLTLLFGVAEFGVALRSRYALTQASRTGARAASVLPRLDGYEQASADAVAASLSGSIPAGNVLNLTIYKADPITGDPVDGTYSTCTTCWRYQWDPSTASFSSIAGSQWPASAQSACGDIGNTDYVGVWVSGEYDLVTTFWSDKLNLSSRVVMRLEPITGVGQCSP